MCVQLQVTVDLMSDGGNIPLIFFFNPFLIYFDSLVAQTVKHLSAMPKTRVRSPGREDPLEKEMATHSSTLA